MPRLRAAAKANPCAAKANPCGAADAVELTDAEARSAYACIEKTLHSAYAASGHPVATGYAGWASYSSQAYRSETHGSRFVMNFANGAAKAYGRYEKAGKMPRGAILAKSSYTVAADGQVGVGPLFIMEKMDPNFYDASGNWRYTMIMPDGSIFGETKGVNGVKWNSASPATPRLPTTTI